MDIEWLAGLVGFAMAMAATPGPNNTIVAASGATFGILRSLPLTIGIATGVGAIMLVVAAFGSTIIADPCIGVTLKWVGVFYLLWLAWKIGSAKAHAQGSGSTDTAQGTPLSFIDGALFQLVNPKLWVMVGGAVVAYGQGADAERMSLACLFAVIFSAATFVSVLVWTILGAFVGHLFSSNLSIRILNAAMAILLVLSLIPIILV